MWFVSLSSVCKTQYWHCEDTDLEEHWFSLNPSFETGNLALFSQANCLAFCLLIHKTGVQYYNLRLFKIEENNPSCMESIGSSLSLSKLQHHKVKATEILASFHSDSILHAFMYTCAHYSCKDPALAIPDRFVSAPVPLSKDGHASTPAQGVGSWAVLSIPLPFHYSFFIIAVNLKESFSWEN